MICSEVPRFSACLIDFFADLFLIFQKYEFLFFLFVLIACTLLVSFTSWVSTLDNPMLFQRNSSNDFNRSLSSIRLISNSLNTFESLLMSRLSSFDNFEFWECSSSSFGLLSLLSNFGDNLPSCFLFFFDCFAHFLESLLLLFALISSNSSFESSSILTSSNFLFIDDAILMMLINLLLNCIIANLKNIYIDLCLIVV